MISMTKYAGASEFTCERCWKGKKSKSRGNWNGLTICNGCYGELLSKGER